MKQQPVALIADSAHGPRIVAVNARAQNAGLSPMMRLADARGLCPAVQAVPHDAAGDRAQIEALALWTQRWGPLSAVDGLDAAIVDTSGVAHLFGGEEAICAMAIADLAQQGFTARTGLSNTPAAAWAMSHYAAAPGVIPDAAAPIDWLAPLPMAALRLDADTLLLLRRLGLKRIGDLANIDREALARRFRNRREADRNPLIRLDQLLGRTAEPILPALAVEVPLVQRRLIEPLLHRALLDQVVSDLAHDLIRLLEARKLGARRVQLRCWRVDSRRIEREIELAAPTRDAAHILRLFSTRLDDIDAGFGIDQLQLLSPWTEPLALAQGNLEGPVTRGIDIESFVDRIVVRLGQRAIGRPLAHASHWPERSQRWSTALATIKASHPILPLYARPLKLLDRPEPISVIYATPEGLPRSFRWRDQVHEIVRVEGPERIAPEWWRERSTARLRDYYRVEDQSGARYWIYRSGTLRDARGGMPDWHLQGLFA